MPAVMSHDIGPVKVDELSLDLQNPLFVDLQFADEGEMIAYLYANADIPERLCQTNVAGGAGGVLAARHEP